MSTGLYLNLSHAASSLNLTLSDGTAVMGTQTYFVTAADLGAAVPAVGSFPMRGNYQPVSCSLTVSIQASTADAVWAALNDIYKAMALASLWWVGTPSATPVIISMSPPGSTTTGSGTPLTAVMMRPIGVGIDLANNKPVRSSGLGFQLDGITITFERQGEWCFPFSSGAGTDRVTGSATATNTTVQTLAFTGVTPTDIRRPGTIAVVTGSSTNSFNGLLAMAGNSNSIQIANFTYTGGRFALAADATFPRAGGGQVVRFTSTTTSVETATGLMNVSSVDRPRFVLSVRNNTAGYTYRVRLGFADTGGAYPIIYTPWRTVDDSTTNARHVVFPSVGLVYGLIYAVRLEISASAVGGTFDINYLAHVDSGDPSAQMFRFGTAFGKAVIRNPLIADDRLLVGFEGAYANEYNVTSRTANARTLPLLSARPPFISTDTVYMLAMVHASNYWVQRTGAPAVDTIQYILNRRRTSITPR